MFYKFLRIDEHLYFLSCNIERKKPRNLRSEGLMRMTGCQTSGGRLPGTDRSGSGDLESQDSRSSSAKNPGTFVPGF